MTSLIAFLPAVLFFAIIGFLYIRENRDRSRWDIPFKDDHERPPGESLREKLDGLMTDLTMDMVIMLIAAMIPLTLLIPNLPTLFVIAILAGAFTALFYSARNTFKNVSLIRRYRVGFDGERLTGHYLQSLLSKGYFVFHDIPMEAYNVDHVVVGPTGVYAIETKTRRKLKSIGRKRAEVIFDGKTLQYPESPPERYGLDSALTRAKGLESWLTSAVGERVKVQPVLALPGWFVKRNGNWNPPVMNPKSIENYIPKYTSSRLSEQQIRQIKHHLSKKCSIKAIK